MALLQTFTGSGIGGAITATFRDGYQIWEKIRANFVTLNDQFLIGTGTPEGVVTATVGRMFIRTDGGSDTALYLKVSGSGNTGWLPVGTSAGVQRTVVTLTDAQIKALPTTGVTIVGAPSSGYRNKLLGVTLRANTTAGAYTNIDATYGDLGLLSNNYWASLHLITDSTTSPALSQVSGFLGVASNRIADLLPGYLEQPATTPNGWVVTPHVASADVDADALVLKADNNGAGNYTGGNAANTLKVTAYHATEAL